METVRFVNTILEAFDPVTRDSIKEYFLHKNEALAEEILVKLNEDIHSTSRLRYRSPYASKQDQLIETIFNAAIRKAPERVQQAIEKQTIKNCSSYPLWKRVVWIQMPTVLSKILGNTIFKLLMSGIILCFTVSTGYAAYEGMRHVVSGRVLTAIINKTSLPVIRLFNTTVGLMESLYGHKWTILAITGVICLLPRVPYLTTFASTINSFAIGVILSIPQSTGRFLMGVAYNIASFGWNSCESMSVFLRNLAEKSQADKLAYLKKDGYLLWAQSCQSLLKEPSTSSPKQILFSFRNISSKFPFKGMSLLIPFFDKKHDL